MNWAMVYVMPPGGVNDASSAVHFESSSCATWRTASLLDRLRTILDVPAERSPSFAHPTPEYVRFEQPPVVESIPPIEIESHRRIEGKVKYYDYGVVSVELELEFELEWCSLVEQSSRWMVDPGTEDRAMKIIHERLKLVAPALVKPYPNQLSEDYYIVHLREATGADGGPATAANYWLSMAARSPRSCEGSPQRCPMRSARKCCNREFPTIPPIFRPGWTAALIYDTQEGAAPSIQLLEYANTQLLDSAIMMRCSPRC